MLNLTDATDESVWIFTAETFYKTFYWPDQFVGS